MQILGRLCATSRHARSSVAVLHSFCQRQQGFDLPLCCSYIACASVSSESMHRASSPPALVTPLGKIIQGRGSTAVSSLRKMAACLLSLPRDLNNHFPRHTPRLWYLGTILEQSRRALWFLAAHAPTRIPLQSLIMCVER